MCDRIGDHSGRRDSRLRHDGRAARERRRRARRASRTSSCGSRARTRRARWSTSSMHDGALSGAQSTVAARAASNSSHRAPAVCSRSVDGAPARAEVAHGARAHGVGRARQRRCGSTFLAVFGLRVLGVHLRACSSGCCASSAACRRSGRCSPESCSALILVGFFSILLLSNIITALSSFFLARDLDLLVSAPVDWFKLYLAKLLETLVHSSWMVVLMAVPMFAAYGVVYLGRSALSAHRRWRRSCRFSSFRR